MPSKRPNRKEPPNRNNSTWKDDKERESSKKRCASCKDSNKNDGSNIWRYSSSIRIRRWRRCTVKSTRARAMMVQTTRPKCMARFLFPITTPAILTTAGEARRENIESNKKNYCNSKNSSRSSKTWTRAPARRRLAMNPRKENFRTWKKMPSSA